MNELAGSAFEQYANEFDDWEGFRQKIQQMSKLAATAEIIVAEVGSKIVGAAVYVGPHRSKAEFFKPEWAVMRMLVVSPAARGQGIGRALTEACLHRARRDRCEILALHTSNIMAVALAMYLKMGFAFYSAAPDIHGVKYGVYTTRVSA
ncbi:MAG TPA: GNAT family N-acetyltransferase [Gammaproteobacteria bacterium]